MATVRMKKEETEILAATRLHKPFDAVAGFDELFVTRGKTRPHVTAPILAKCEAGHNRHLVLGQQPNRELLLRQPR